MVKLIKQSSADEKSHSISGHGFPSTLQLRTARSPKGSDTTLRILTCSVQTGLLGLDSSRGPSSYVSLAILFSCPDSLADSPSLPPRDKTANKIKTCSLPIHSTSITALSNVVSAGLHCRGIKTKGNSVERWTWRSKFGTEIHFVLAVLVRSLSKLSYFYGQEAEAGSDLRRIPAEE